MSELTLCIRRSDGKEEHITFSDKEKFLQSTHRAIDRRKANNKLCPQDALAERFIAGEHFAAEEAVNLKRALRFFDEVYLYNEFHEALEECGKIAEVWLLL